MTGLQEQVIALGPRRALCGIVTVPARPLENAPVVVLLSAGILHRVGANRLHVTVARRLAAQGYCAVRFDLSGIGDSEPREDALSLFDGALADIREVLDHLEKSRGAREFVLAGMCSGAMHALAAAHGDARVVGAVMLDLFIPRTHGFYVRHYIRKSANLAGAWRLLTGRHPMWRRLRRRFTGDGDQGASISAEDVHGPTLERIRAGMTRAFETVVNRDVKLLAVFTEGHPGHHNYRRQLLHAFPDVRFGSVLRLEYLRGADHTFTLVRNQERLVALVGDWISQFFPGEGPPRPRLEPMARYETVIVGEL